MTAPSTGAAAAPVGPESLGSAAGAQSPASMAGASGAVSPAEAGGVAVLILDGAPEEVEATVTSARVVSCSDDEVHVCASWAQGARQAHAP